MKTPCFNNGKHGVPVIPRNGVPIIHIIPMLPIIPIIPIILLLLLSGCKPKDSSAPEQETALRQEKTAAQKRLMLAQIVEDAEPNVFAESAVIEGAPYQWFLRSLVGVSHDKLRERTNKDITFDKLLAQPGLYRGQVVTLRRGVVLEVSRAPLPPEYGLPPGYTVLPAVFVDSFRNVYALRILCPPKSKLYEKLQQGLDQDAVPVMRLTDTS